MQANDWKDESSVQWLARAFARTERAFITACYSPEVLQEGKLFMLPSMHRFGWYCAQAFEMLDQGDTVGYAKSLRAGLVTCGNMKPFVEFLMEHTPELQAPPPSQELLELAEKVRTMLAACDPSDPAVEAIKQSAAYRKVRRLIEGPDLDVHGGLKQ